MNQPKDAQTRTALEEDGTVFIVDDDEGMREGLEFLVSSAGYAVRKFASAGQFLEEVNTSAHGCLLLDLRMPGMNGLELLAALRRQRRSLPVIIVTAYADVPVAVKAMKTGAFGFVEKPFDGALLLGQVRAAMNRDARQRVSRERAAAVQDRYESLTPREREVMRLVCDGLLNKQIAGELGISIKTVENHRAQVMEKMGYESLAELVRGAVAARLLDAPEAPR